MRTNAVYHGDCVDELGELPDDSVDLVIADPPYNLSGDASETGWDEKDWEQFDEDWDAAPWAEYERFTREWIREVARVTKPTGSAWVFGSYHNTPFINLAIREHGEILNEVIWAKRNAFPNIRGRRLTASHETILWGHFADDREYTFNYETSKQVCGNRSSFRDTGKQLRSVWDIPTTKCAIEQEHSHPAQKPLSVLDRIIHIASDEGDVVLDPFAGSGATLAAANMNGREWVGIERDDEYAALAEEYATAVSERPDGLPSSPTTQSASLDDFST